MMFQKTFKMTAVILSVLMLASCAALRTPASLNTSSETSEKSRKTHFSEPTTETSGSDTADNTDNPTDAESSETSMSVGLAYNGHYEKAKWSIEPTVIHDGHGVKITAEELLNTQKHDSIAIAFWIENESDEALTFSVNELAVNTLCSRVLSYEPKTIESHNSDTFFVSIPLDYLETFGITEIGRLDLAIKGVNPNGYESIAPDPVTIFTDHKDSMQMPSLPSAEVLLDDEVFCVSVMLVGATSKTPSLFRIIATNRSDRELTIKTDRLWFGGRDLGSAIMITVPAGMSRDVYYSFEDKVIKKSVSSQKVTQMEISFAYHIPGEYNSDKISEIKSFSVN